MKQELVAQMLTDFESELNLSGDLAQMQPWDIIIAMRDHLPPHEQKVAELFVKLGEAQEILNELHA
ncbi:MAG: hypothetical protein FWB96_12040 [Defluviitaleaceae bacterium]|nr:hypothetical protein [Defluviitaleaceae bacterium]MCL2263145.1 hypothetical protein [Defluviitaleaceae bacterium]